MKTTNNPVYDTTDTHLRALMVSSEQIGRLKTYIEIREWAVIQLETNSNPNTINVIKELLRKCDNA